MAFCTGCGKPLSEGARFCTSCGAPVASMPAPSNASGTPPGVAAAPAPAPVTISARTDGWDNQPQPRSGVPATMIVAGIILVILVGIAVGTTLYLRSGKTDRAATATTPAGGAFSTNPGIPIYPGATTIAETEHENAIAAFRTRDTPQQVIGFYKVRFPVSVVSASESGEELRATLPDGSPIRVSASIQPGGTEVHIYRDR